jgi:hypothetical protein
MSGIVLGRRLDLIAVIFRLAFVLAIVVAFGRMAATQEADVSNYLKKISKSISISCETIEVYQYKGEISIAPTNAQQVKVDLDGCQLALMSTDGNQLLKPLLDGIVSSSADSSVEFDTLTEEQKQKQRNEVELKQKRIADEVKVRARSLFETCLKQGASIPKSQNKICYFGAPTAASGAAFKAAYEAMVKHSLPEFRSLCAPDPITKSTKIEPEFIQLQKSAPHPISWKEIRQSIENDGFFCRDETRCEKWILEVNLPSIYAVKNLSNDAMERYPLFLRYLEIHGGDGHTVGPPSFCRSGTHGGCESEHPERGTKSGICMAAEDWHVWFHIQMLLNYEPDKN